MVAEVKKKKKRSKVKVQPKEDVEDIADDDDHVTDSKSHMIESIEEHGTCVMCS